MSELSDQILLALGGHENLEEISNCATRLRLVIKDLSQMNEEGLRKINGVRGVIAKGNSVQVIIGTHVEHVADEIKASAGYHRN